MIEQLSSLIALQEIDDKIRACEQEKDRIPELIAAVERRRAGGIESLENAKAELQAAQKDKRDRDKDLEAGLQKVEKLKSRTSEIKTNKEYQALLKEIEAAEQENKAIEDEILALMEKIDAASDAVKKSEISAAEEEAALLKEKKLHDEKLSAVESEISGLNKLRKDASTRVEPSVLSKYHKLAKAIGSAVIAEARAESCMGCHMSIPPQLYVNVKKNSEILTCPYCRRILYFKG